MRYPFYFEAFVCHWCEQFIHQGICRHPHAVFFAHGHAEFHGFAIDHRLIAVHFDAGYDPILLYQQGFGEIIFLHTAARGLQLLIDGH